MEGCGTRLPPVLHRWHDGHPNRSCCKATHQANCLERCDLGASSTCRSSRIQPTAAEERLEILLPSLLSRQHHWSPLRVFANVLCLDCRCLLGLLRRAILLLIFIVFCSAAFLLRSLLLLSRLLLGAIGCNSNVINDFLKGGGI